MDHLIDDADRLPELPPEDHPLRALGQRLAELLDEDQWAECERLLLEGWEHDRIDRKTGADWRENSSLEVWFPFTAEAIATAYGYLWHVNNEPGTPNQYPPERAAYEARKLLRDQMTHEKRGDAINRVRELIRHNSGYTIRCDLFGEVGPHEHKDGDLDALIDAQMVPNVQLEGAGGGLPPKAPSRSEG